MKKLFECSYPNGHWIYVRAHNKKQALEAASDYVNNVISVFNYLPLNKILVEEIKEEPESYSVKGDYIYPWQVLIEVE